MHPIFAILFASFFLQVCQAEAQTQWKRVEQKALNIIYEVPSNWFMSGYQEGKSCNCSGGSLDVSPDGHVKLVIFSSDQVSMDSLKQQLIGHLYRFKEDELLPDIYKNDFFRFERKTSTRRLANNSGDIVVRLTGYHEEYNYVIYLITSYQYQEQLQPIAERIMRSLEPYEKEEY